MEIELTRLPLWLVNELIFIFLYYYPLLVLHYYNYNNLSLSLVLVEPGRTLIFSLSNRFDLTFKKYQSIYMYYHLHFYYSMHPYGVYIGIKNKGGRRIFLWLLYQCLLRRVRVHAVSEGIICHRLSSSSSSSSSLSPTSCLLFLILPVE